MARAGPQAWATTGGIASIACVQQYRANCDVTARIAFDCCKSVVEVITMVLPYLPPMPMLLSDEVQRLLLPCKQPADPSAPDSIDLAAQMTLAALLKVGVRGAWLPPEAQTAESDQVDVPCNFGLSCCAAHAGADVLQLAHVPVGGDGQRHGERVGGDSQGVCEWLNIWGGSMFMAAAFRCVRGRIVQLVGSTPTLSMLLLCILIRAGGAKWCGTSVLRHIRAPFGCARACGAGLPAGLLADRCACAGVVCVTSVTTLLPNPTLIMLLSLPHSGFNANSLQGQLLWAENAAVLSYALQQWQAGLGSAQLQEAVTEKVVQEVSLGRRGG